MRVNVAAGARHILRMHNFGLTLRGRSAPREQASAMVEANGGRVASSVSKKTSFVLVGADAGSKFEKAKELGVRIVDEAEFRNLVGS